MFCPRCATQNTDDAKFCRSCGTDISLVPQAVTGQLAERLAAQDGGGRGEHRRRKHAEQETPTIERAVRHLFLGVAFVIVAFSVKTWMPGGFVWWFWLFIPAFGLMADGVSTYLRLAEDRKKLAQPSYAQPPDVLAQPPRAAPLPPRNTGEIIAPPSVTEGTTRHLSVPPGGKAGDV